MLNMLGEKKHFFFLESFNIMSILFTEMVKYSRLEDRDLRVHSPSSRGRSSKMIYSITLIYRTD